MSAVNGMYLFTTQTYLMEIITESAEKAMSAVNMENLREKTVPPHPLKIHIDKKPLSARNVVNAQFKEAL